MTDIKWNKKGFEVILCSDGASQVCRSHAEATCAAANAKYTGKGTGFGTNVMVRFLYRSNRICWQVRSLEYDAYLEQRNNQILTGSIQ